MEVHDYKVNRQREIVPLLITDKYLKWVIENYGNHTYLLFLTHYLIGKYQRVYPDKNIKKASKLIDFLIRVTPNLYESKEKVNWDRFPKLNNNNTIEAYNEYYIQLNSTII
jgi:hypothetical protein